MILEVLNGLRYRGVALAMLNVLAVLSSLQYRWTALALFTSGLLKHAGTLHLATTTSHQWTQQSSTMMRTLV